MSILNGEVFFLRSEIQLGLSGKTVDIMRHYVPKHVTQYKTLFVIRQKATVKSLQLLRVTTWTITGHS